MACVLGMTAYVNHLIKLRVSWKAKKIKTNLRIVERDCKGRKCWLKCMAPNAALSCNIIQ